jgi:hypothetical protein
MFRSVAITLTLCLATATAQAAPVKYQYQGPNFNAGNSPVDGLTGISGYFVLADAIAPNALFHSELDMPELDAAPIELWFTDGVTTITSLSELIDWGFSVETDGAGAPSVWQVALIKAGNGPSGTFLRMNVEYNWLPESGFDVSVYCNNEWATSCPSQGGRSVVTDALNHGTWTIAVVPVPPAVWLFGSALGLMGWMRRKVAA